MTSLEVASAEDWLLVPWLLLPLALQLQHVAHWTAAWWAAERAGSGRGLGSSWRGQNCHRPALALRSSRQAAVGAQCLRGVD